MPVNIRFSPSRISPSLLRLLIGLLTILLVLTKASSRASASGIFGPALKAMECIVNGASANQNLSSTLLTKLPSYIFGAITLFIFAYILICLNQIFQAVRNGEEMTNVAIPFMSCFVGLVVIGIFQNLLFGSGGC